GCVLMSTTRHVLGVDYPLVGLAIRLWWVSFASASDASSDRATITDQSSEGVIKPCRDISPSQGPSYDAIATLGSSQERCSSCLATRQQMSHSNARCKAPIRVRWIKMVIR